MDSIYAGDNVINNGEFGYNNMQQIVGTWTHKFNDKIYTATEAWVSVGTQCRRSSHGRGAISKWVVSGPWRLRA